jgi:hypothetical protein
MRRIALLLPCLFVLLGPAATAAASSYVYDVPDLVARPLVAVKKASDIPVLLPSRMTTEFRKLYSAGRGRKTRYKFEIGAVKDCHSATACFVAEFSGRQGGKASGKRKVELAHGLTGWFHPTRCGASCASPGIEWEQGGVLYEIEAKLGTKKTERKILTRLANSAIRNGPR